MRRHKGGHTGVALFPPALLFTIVLAMATAGLLVGDAMLVSKQVPAAGRRFQRVAGGLGMGATVCPRWCFINFDPRIERCTCMEQPLAGGYCYCPEHSGTVSSFSVLAAPRRDGQPPPRRGGGP